MTATEFITTLVMHFPVRHESPARETEWMDTLIKAVKHYDRNVLEKAAQHIIDNRTDRRFPLPAEIRKACSDVVREDERRRLPLNRDALQAPEWSTERELLANQMIVCETGRRAAEGGWILGLHNFIRKHARMPLHHEIDKLKRDAADFDEIYPRSGPWMPLGNKMLAERERLAKRLTG